MKDLLILQLEEFLSIHQMSRYGNLVEQIIKIVMLKFILIFQRSLSNWHKKFMEIYCLQNKAGMVISRDDEGYHSVKLIFDFKGPKIAVKARSMLKDTWGVALN